MPKVSVYLPDDLYRAARDRGLSVSSLTQQAVQAALGAAETDRWIASVRSRPARVSEVLDTAELISEVRDDFGR
ncbi:MAG: type II toxin-antitoxin system CcdA family antitoxin [Geodermatophilaceae bacterium]